MGLPRADGRRATTGRQRHPSAPRRPVAAPDLDAPRRWRERRWFALVVRVVVFVLPIAASFLVAMWLSRRLPVPEPFAERALRWLGIALVSTVVLVVVQRLVRRVLPLSALLSLTLVFPDAAPSRFRLALRSISARGLERSLQSAGPSTDTPQDAAERLLVLVGALSRHDRLTRGHSERVRAYCVMIGEEMGLSPAELDRLRWAGLLHDVGKLQVPPDILNKPGRLTDEEFAIVRQHTTHGAKLTEGLRGWLGDDVDAVDQHHERWGGGGYPYGLRGTSITRSARIVAVADAFDVMTSARSYKKPIPAADARAELERCAGSQFDPTVVRAMLSISLGALWRAMGPLSWAAQLRLFPRQVAQASTPAMTSTAVAVSMAITAVASAIGAPAGPVEVASSPVVAVADVEQPEPTSPPPSVAPQVIDAVPASSVAASTTTTTSSTTTSSTTTTSIVESGALPPTEGPVVIVRPTTTVRTPGPAPADPVTTVASTTTQPRAPGPTTSTTTAPTTTIAATTTAPTTTTAPPTPAAPLPSSGTFAIGSSGAGDVGAQDVLPIRPSRTPVNASVANYDVDRNADPGLTLVRTSDALVTANPAGVQTWEFSDRLDEIPRLTVATMYVSAATELGPGAVLEVRAGIFRCNPTRLNCEELRASTARLPATAPGAFTAVIFDLSAPSRSTRPSGWHYELRIAVPDGSAGDVWVAYDAADAPATITLAR